jgi:xanthosine utilization system XapX-like protein
MVTKESVKKACNDPPIVLTLGVLGVLVGAYRVYKMSK